MLRLFAVLHPHRGPRQRGFCKSSAKSHPFGTKSQGPQPQLLPQASEDLKLDLPSDLLPNLEQAALKFYICSKVKITPAAWPEANLQMAHALHLVKGLAAHPCDSSAPVSAEQAVGRWATRAEPIPHTESPGDGPRISKGPCYQPLQQRRFAVQPARKSTWTCRFEFGDAAGCCSQES